MRLRRMRIWVLDPFLTAERRLWIDGWARHSRHSLFAFTLHPPSGPFSSFRLDIARNRAERLARRIRRYLTGSAARDPSRQPAGLPDLVIMTDGMDGAVFAEETADLLASIPIWVYWHVSALACPEISSPEARAVEIHTVRAVRRCLFHGESQRQRFLAALFRYDEGLATAIAKSTAVLPPGFTPFPTPSEVQPSREPLALWILRGEPEEIPRMIAAMDHRDLGQQSFRLLLLSERPEIEANRVMQLPHTLRARILGILNPEDPKARRWISTARAVVEGSIRLHSPIHLMRIAFEGPWPLLPSGSTLLDQLPESIRALCAYRDPKDLAERLAAALQGVPGDPQEIRQALTAWTWPVLAPRYDELCETAYAM